MGWPWPYVSVSRLPIDYVLDWSVDSEEIYRRFKAAGPEQFAGDGIGEKVMMANSCQMQMSLLFGIMVEMLSRVYS